MKSLLRLFSFGVLLLVCLAGPAYAQIMRITTDNPDNNTAMNPSGITLLTITLDPSSSLEGSGTYCHWSVCSGGPAQLCYSWPACVGCSPTCNSWESLQVDGYRIILTAVGGTMTWGTFTPADGAPGSQTATSTQIELTYGRLAATSDLFTVGTIQVTTASPFTTHIEIGRIGPSSWGTWLSMKDCGDAFFGYPYPYLLGYRANPCYEPSDWFDAFGTISAMDACLAKTNHGQCEVCCLNLGGTANTCSKFCKQIKGGAGEPLP